MGNFFEFQKVDSAIPQGAFVDDCIPATLNLHTGTPKSANVKRRAAGYARVSTDSDEQFTSYTAQMDYYTSYIKRNPNWEFVDVYTDEGICGVSTKNREGFNRMISDALAGKIDLIVTKSVSRFARNTVDSLTTVRKLKEKGVEVYFEKENINTLDSKGEVLLTIMASLAQQESESLSANVRMGIQYRNQQGKLADLQAQMIAVSGDEAMVDALGEQIDGLRAERQSILAEAAERSDLQERMNDMIRFLDEMSTMLTEYSDTIPRRLVEKNYDLQ